MSTGTPSGGNHKRGDSQSSYYFVHSAVATAGGGPGSYSNATRDAGDETSVIEVLPPGSVAEDFAPRVLDIGDHHSVRSALSSVKNKSGGIPKTIDGGNSASRSRSSSRKQREKYPSLFSYFFGANPSMSMTHTHDYSGAHKVDPKVFFAAERTYLAWMHASILLAGVSIAISAYAETGSASDVYGIMILPISVVFMIYAMVQCTLS